MSRPKPKEGIRWGVVFPPHDLRDALDLAQHADAAGYDLVAVGDTSTRWPDPYVVLSAMVGRTTRARLGPMVTNPVTRHPATTANAIASLQQLSDGRAVLGMGRGDNAVRNLGVRPSTCEELEHSVRAVRALLHGDAVPGSEGVMVRRSWPARPVPVVVAARGRRVLRLAGRLADGVLLGGGLLRDDLAEAVASVHEGARSAGRDPSSIEVMALGRVAAGAPGPDHEIQIASLLASVCHHSLSDPEAAGVPTELIGAVRELVRRYDPSHHVEPGLSPNAGLVRELGLFDYLLDRFAFVSSPEEIRRRGEELADLGIDTVILGINPGPGAIDHLVSILDG